MSEAMVLGVWAALAVATVAWTALTAAVSPRLPSLSAMLGAFLRSWVGRSYLLLLWGYLGWHLFCQRP